MKGKGVAVFVGVVSCRVLSLSLKTSLEDSTVCVKNLQKNSLVLLHRTVILVKTGLRNDQLHLRPGARNIFSKGGQNTVDTLNRVFETVDSPLLAKVKFLVITLLISRLVV